ncbi:GNAT family N-acetyltransferase [Alkalihalobacillus sp. R86527]|uniref:GNAT family N-acetyltransferase n=1 Tax=Alkalihalobacillus sp. R86527 TaxID=3093863 RepID=UPI00366C2FC6
MIKYLTYSDYGLLENMNTNIRNDYILRIFPRLVQQESLIGYFENDRLIGIAGLTLFENEIAILGRLRTDVSYRGKGIATTLMKALIEKAYMTQSLKWVGYATEMDNIPANQLSKRLNMTRESILVSARVGPGIIHGIEGQSRFNKRTNSRLKRSTVLKAFNENQFSFFPYEIYYPLPYIPSLSHLYIEKIELYSSEVGSFFLTREEKGDSYLHVKLFNPTLLKNKQMWNIINKIANDEGRTIWIDLPIEYEDLLGEAFQKTYWHLIGQGREMKL